MRMRFDTEALTFDEITRWIGGSRGPDAECSSALRKLRTRILREGRGTKEKVNGHKNGPYFGYYLNHSSDVAYIYVQAGGLVVDIRLTSIAAAVRRAGIRIRPRNNYQERNGGWTTGLRLPHDANDDKIEAVAGQILTALRGQG